MGKENRKEKKQSDEEKDEHSNVKEVTSDALVADLLNDIIKSDQPFSMDELAVDTRKRKKHAKEEKKESKKHKKKKSKKSKSKHKHRDRSRSASSRSGTRSRRSSSSRSRSPESKKAHKDSKNSHSPERSVSAAKKTPVFDRISSEDDDLPVGADYTSLHTKVTNGNASKNPEPSPAAEPDISCSVEAEDAFPIAKDRKRSPSPDFVEKKIESELLKKVIEEKGKPDLVPRNLKINFGKINLPTPESVKKNGTEEDTAIAVKDEPVEDEKKPAPAEVHYIEDAKKEVKDLPAEDISDGSLDGDVASGAVIRRREKKPQVRTRSRSSSASSSDSRNTDELIVSKVTRGRGTKRMKLHSERDRNRGGKTNSRRAKSPRSYSRRKRSRSSSRSRSRSGSNRRRSSSRSRSRSESRDRDRGRTRYSPKAKSTRDYGRGRNRRSPSRDGGRGRYGSRRRGGSGGGGGGSSSSYYHGKREKIDKQKLLEIAKKKARTLQQMGIMTATGELSNSAVTSGKSIDELVEYCQRLSKREEKEARRIQGETVSSDSDLEDFAAKVKHPYDVKPAASGGPPIMINIANASMLPVRSAQERMLDESTLRLCYPVSSGQVHKESTETEWQRVEKEELPVTVTDAVKQQKAVTSLEIEEARKKGIELPPPPPVPMLPPPPLPPVFEGLSAPPVPPSFDSFLPPPPLPPMIIPAPEDKIIIKEPKTNRKAPKDVGKVLAQRAAAAKRLDEDPNDYEARNEIRELDEQMEAWAAKGSLPGKFTGSTGVRVLSADELQPHDPRYHAWAKKDQFKTMQPVTTGVGLRLMQKMGWRPGEGLGKDNIGSLEPLLLDVKFDRKGLAASAEQRGKKGGVKVPVVNVNANSQTAPGGAPPASNLAFNPPGLGDRNAISVVMEMCAKRRWIQPEFVYTEEGPSNNRRFNCSVTLNGVQYTPAVPSTTKKAAKTLACQVALQAVGFIQ